MDSAFYQTGVLYMEQPGPVLVWRRSSFCGGEASCVEVAEIGDHSIAVRDSKLSASSPYLTFYRNTWGAFVGAVKAGEYHGAH
jgi:hypothetical protein